jgi:hypothetical protein
VNKGNAVKKIILFVPAFERNLKKEENRTELELGLTTLIPICGTSMICYFWRFKKPHEEVSALLIQLH